ncbi:outer membrane lipoprotein Slp family protein [Geobacter sp. OR-1]|uniref:Slp family lipoprotein n=1 Tax=Geobacter sp. OR-1 TaxID=1266765 RepID=UPI000541CB7D|nr:Slp family lipoprotein [Geobacter sp. OR-1]GAM09368.1 outer membrane lipoprotein Slp family protein [Geobacter sp. OR-1]
MKTSVAAVAISIAVLSGCVHVMNSDESLQVSPASYEEIRDKPQAYQGKTVMLGGVISNVLNSPQGAEIEVIQYRLDEDGFPDDSLGSSGRFLATSPTLLDTDLYPKGVPITIVGEVKPERQTKTKWESARLPVIAIRQSHLWTPEQERKLPFLIPGTNLVDPYYHGHDTPLPKRPLGIKTDIW